MTAQSAFNACEQYLQGQDPQDTVDEYAIQREQLRKRWYKLKYHPVQSALWRSTARFNICPSGRRSGKTEILGKRKVIMRALRATKYPDTRVFVSAPTRDQAKRIYWNDLKSMVPPWLLAAPPSESHLYIPLINGSEVHCLGMDKPERIEGTPWDHGVLDEYGNMKPQTWEEHVRPALADRRGSCDFIGVPEGRNHYYDLYRAAKADTSGNWATYHWISADILDEEEIKQAKRDLDELTYQQEFEGSFVRFAGSAYYNFNDGLNCHNLKAEHYDAGRPLVLAFDFNESPGVAAIIQELPWTRPGQIHVLGMTTTAVIGEVYIKRHSNTIRVCRKILKDWSLHKGIVICYGDATGGAGGSAKVQGSDWDLVKKELYPVFGNRLHFKVPASNPRERARVNAVNSRLYNSLNEVYLVVDESVAPNTVKDFEGTRVIEGGTGEIDKKRDPLLTHLTDAIGYYVTKEYPLRRLEIATGPKFWK